jgi:hypothetical protein
VASSAVAYTKRRDIVVVLSTLLFDGLLALLHFNLLEKAVRHLSRSTEYYNLRSTYDLLNPVK